jgi:hypothetical protein
MMSAIIQVTGAGAIQNQTFLQKAHNRKDIQDAHERLEWKQIVMAKLMLELEDDLSHEGINVHELLLDKKKFKRHKEIQLPPAGTRSALLQSKVKLKEGSILPLQVDKFSKIQQKRQPTRLRLVFACLKGSPL